jgi:copper chaperone CopZ
MEKMVKMKILFICLVSLFFIINTGCNTQTSPVKEIKIKLDFFCEHGKSVIEKELKAQAGIDSVNADLKTQVVIIKYDTTKFTKDKLVTTLENIGFKTEFTKPETEIKKSCPGEMNK